MLEKSLGGFQGISVRKASGQRLKGRHAHTLCDSKGFPGGCLSCLQFHVRTCRVGKSPVGAFLLPRVKNGGGSWQARH